MLSTRSLLLAASLALVPVLASCSGSGSAALPSGPQGKGSPANGPASTPTHKIFTAESINTPPVVYPYDARTGAAENPITFAFCNSNASVRDLTLSPDGSRLYVSLGLMGTSAIASGTIAVIDTTTDAIAGTIATPPYNLESSAISDDGSTLFTYGSTDFVAGSTAPPAIVVSNLATLRAVKTIPIPAGEVGSGHITINHAASTAYVVSNSRVDVIDLTSGHETATIPQQANGERFESAFISPDDTTLYLTSDFHFYRINTSTNAVVASNGIESGESAWALSKDGTELFGLIGSGVDAGAVHVISTSTFTEIANIAPPQSYLAMTLRFNNAGTTLYAAGGAPYLVNIVNTTTNTQSIDFTAAQPVSVLAAN